MYERIYRAEQIVNDGQITPVVSVYLTDMVSDGIENTIKYRRGSMFNPFIFTIVAWDNA